MTIDEIINLWKEDVCIDKTELGHESLRIPILHGKYLTILNKEKKVLRRLEAEMKQLKLDKYEFFTQGPSEETRDKGWKLPPKGMILKSDLPMYMDADKDIIELNLKIGEQMDKIEYLDSVIRTIMNRGYLIKNAIDWQKFTMGS